MSYIGSGPGRSLRFASYSDTTGGTSCDSTSETKLSIWSEDFADDIYSLSSGTVTVGQPGLYEIHISLTITGTTANYRYQPWITLKKNGTEIGAFYGGHIRASSQQKGYFMNASYSRLYQLEKDDEIEVFIQRASTISGNATTVANMCNLHFIQLQKTVI